MNSTLENPVQRQCWTSNVGQARSFGFLQWLQDESAKHFSRPAAIVVAHPDDEVIGAGALLPRLEHLAILHVTDGAPRNLLDANREGFSSREAYAAARVCELHQALSLAGHRPEIAANLGFVDQETSFHMVEITRRLFTWFAAGVFEVVLTHPYEGGHPDHDATALCVHTACRLLRREGLAAPELVEMTSYFNRFGAMAVGEFLPAAGTAPIRKVLSPQARDRKARMLGSFATQQLTLKWFPVEAESFRRAPEYDFTSPPHGGALYYELFEWGVTGPRWRELARDALVELQS